ncbi:hypothetical protein DID76_02430 [Candidatus Marinamargulisbacteria bacterium SCGC AG-414-C22]|nr:hypothetical protein DID76_02430 [Candidatus Marinamargulisbacteria bacterium SCGC AG-414-C22]
MNIDRTFLDDLSQSDLQFATAVLKKIFVENDTNLVFEQDADCVTLVTLIRSAKVDQMKKRLFGAFSLAAQQQLLTHFDDTDQFVLVLSLSLLTEMKHHYDLFNDAVQKSFLDYFYTHHHLRYKEFLDLISGDSLHIRQGVIIDKVSVSMTDLLQDVSSLMDLIANDERNVTDVKEFSQVLVSKYQDHEVTIFIREFIVRFFDLKLSLNHKKHFVMYLKFFNSILLFFVVKPELEEYVFETLDHFLMSLDVIKDATWRMKLLDQLPAYILKLILSRLQRYEKVSQSYQRNFFCKLLNELTEHTQADTKGHIRYVFDQL